MWKYRKNRICIVIVAFILMVSMAACSQSDSPASDAPVSSAPADTVPAAGDSSSPSGGNDQADWVTLELKYATYLPDSNIVIASTIDKVQEELDKAMPGKIKITKYTNGTLLGQSDIYDGILNGTCDIGMVDFGTVKNRFPLTQLLSLPGIEMNGDTVSTLVYNEWVNTTKPAEYDDVVFLIGTGNGPLCFYTKTPVEKPADLKGMQLRASAIFTAVVTQYGATPVTMDTSEIYEAYRNGLIDGIYSMFGAAAQANLDELGGYALINPLETFVHATMMNKNTFNKMPASQQEAFMGAIKAAIDNNLFWAESQLGEGRTAEAAQNVPITWITGDKASEFNALTQPMVDAYVKDLDDKGLDATGNLEKIREIANTFNQEITWDDYLSYFPEDYASGGAAAKN